MNAIQHIRVALDVSSTNLKVAGPSDMMRLWEGLEHQVAGRVLKEGAREKVSAGTQVVYLDVVSNSSSECAVSDQTRFEIVSISEKADIKYACATCHGSGVETYGPFVCFECKKSNRDNRVCEDHVIIIDGSNRSYCPQHHPKCNCGQDADFWCNGPRCKGNKSWCNDHGVKNSNVSDEIYCKGCFEELFPSCSHQNCRKVGSLRCEFVPKDGGAACGKAGCSKHMSRWQIFGPQTEGIVLCEEHRSRRYLDPRDLVADVLRSTAWRNSKAWRKQNLPTLQSFRHVLRQKMSKNFNVSEISAMFDNLRAPNSGHKKYVSEAGLLLKRYEKQRKELLKKNTDEMQEGRAIFQRMVALLLEMGQDELASVVSFSDYRPRNKRLFVVVPEDYRGRFIGAGGKNIKELKMRLGVTVDIEKSR